MTYLYLRPEAHDAVPFINFLLQTCLLLFIVKCSALLSPTLALDAINRVERTWTTECVFHRDVLGTFCGCLHRKLGQVWYIFVFATRGCKCGKVLKYQLVMAIAHPYSWDMLQACTSYKTIIPIYSIYYTIILLLVLI